MSPLIFQATDGDGDVFTIEHYHAPGNNLAADGKEAVAAAVASGVFVYLSADDLSALRASLPAPAETVAPLDTVAATILDPAKVWLVEDEDQTLPKVYPSPLRVAALKEARDILSSVTSANFFGGRTVSADDLVTLAAYLADGRVA